MTSSVVTTSAPSAAAFVASIGICQEVRSVDEATQVAGSLAYLGIGHLRTSYTSSQNLLAAGQLGAKIDLITPWYMRATTNADINRMITSVLEPAASVMEAVEGPNEINNGDPDTFNGVGGAQGFIAMQKYLYASVKADPALRNVSVYNFSLSQGADMSTYTATGNLADYNNVHAYSSAGIPADWFLPYETSHNRTAGDKPVVLTEVGATTITTVGVSETMQARFDVEVLLDAFKLGVPRTYLFNLRDWDPSSDTSNFSAHYGLYNVDGTPKLAATAIHNLTTILNGGATAATTGNSLSYGITGLPSTGQQLLLSKGGGKFDLVLWNEAYYWNTTNHTEQNVATSRVTVTFNSAQNASIYDPLISTAPLATSNASTSITVNFSKDPIILEIGPTQPLGNVTPSAVTISPDIKLITGIRSGGVTLSGTSSPNSTVMVSSSTNGVTTLLGSATTTKNGTWSFTSQDKVNMALINSYTVSAQDDMGRSGAMAGKLYLGSTSPDTLSGTSGVADVFAIMSFRGADVISGFEATSKVGVTHDTIDFSGRGITSFAQVQSMMSGTTSTILAIGSGKTVTLTNVAPTDLRATDFSFS